MEYSGYTPQPQVPQPNTPMFQTQEGYQPQLYEPQGPRMNNYGMSGPGMLPPATGAGYDFNLRNQDAVKRAKTCWGMSIACVICLNAVCFLLPVIIFLIVLFTVILPQKAQFDRDFEAAKAKHPK